MIKFRTTVKRVERKHRVARAWKVGDSVRTEQEDLGWAILLHGSFEWLFIGDEPPDFTNDDTVEVTIAKVP